MVRATVDPKLKSETDKIFSELGSSTTDAIRMFLAQVKLRRGLPFAVGLPSSNDVHLTTPKMRQLALDSVHEDQCPTK